MERRFSDPKHRFPDGRMPLDAHRVGELYQQIIDVIRNPRLIPDAAFDESSYEYQASWDEWGRGYRPAPYLLDAEGNKAEDADPDELPRSTKRKRTAPSRPPQNQSRPTTTVRVRRPAGRIAMQRQVLRARRPGGNPHRSGRSASQDCETGRGAASGPQQAPEEVPPSPSSLTSTGLSRSTGN